STSRSANNPRSPIIAASNYLEFEILDIEQLGNIVPRLEVPEMMATATIPPPAPPPRDPALRLWVVLARAFDAVERHARASIARFDLGTTEFGVLEVLYHKGRLPVCEVQRRILIESGSTTYVVDKLVRRGLVRRESSASDRRQRPLALTARGRRLMGRIFPPHARTMRRAVAGLSPRQQRQALGLLRTLGLAAAGRPPGEETDDDP